MRWDLPCSSPLTVVAPRRRCVRLPQVGRAPAGRVAPGPGRPPARAPADAPAAPVRPAPRARRGRPSCPAQSTTPRPVCRASAGSPVKRSANQAVDPATTTVAAAASTVPRGPDRVCSHCSRASRSSSSRPVHVVDEEHVDRAGLGRGGRPRRRPPTARARSVGRPGHGARRRAPADRTVVSALLRPLPAGPATTTRPPGREVEDPRRARARCAPAAARRAAGGWRSLDGAGASAGERAPRRCRGMARPRRRASVLQRAARRVAGRGPYRAAGGPGPRTASAGRRRPSRQPGGPRRGWPRPTA